jgi:lipoprotein signal peptidase
MGYLKVDDGAGFSVAGTKGLWLYAILAIPLILLTFAVYFLSELHNRRNPARRWEVVEETEKVEGGEMV